MADLITLPPQGTGTTTPVVATDEVNVGGSLGVAHVQFLKLVDGTLNGTDPIASGGGAETNALRVTLADGGPLQDVFGTTSLLANAALKVGGGAAHDAASSGIDPVLAGAHALGIDAAPTAVSAVGDLTRLHATRDGILFVAPFHPNTQSLEYVATSAKTNDILISAPGAGQHTVIQGIYAVIGADGDLNPGVRIGWGATVPAEPTDGNSVADVVLSHPSVALGSGVVAGFPGVGPANTDLRISCDDPQTATGQLVVIASYYTQDG